MKSFSTQIKPIIIRAWDSEQKEFVDFEYWREFLDDGEITTEGEVKHAKNIFITSWTGFYDIEGRRIFEGDIYNLCEYNNNPYVCTYCRGEYFNRPVKYSTKDFLKSCVNVPRDMQHTLATHFKIAIIKGNIFENPELLLK